MGKGIEKQAVVPVEAVLLAIALILISLRLFLRLVLQRTTLTLSDWLLIASGVDAIALFATDAAAYNLGGMDDYDPEAAPKPEADQIALMKITFAGNYLYDTGIYLPKLALIAFYYRLIPQTMPILRKILHVAAALTILFAVTTCFVDTFWCGSHVSVNWDLQGSCSSFESMEIVQIDWALNITSDIIIFSIPFPMLRGLQVKRRYLFGLIATFSLGLITVGASVSRFATIQVIHAWTNVYVLSMAEMAAAIIVVCLPALKSLMHRTDFSSYYRRGATTSSSGNAYKSQASARSHIRLASGRDGCDTSTRIAVVSEDTGSEVELNNMQSGVIYKSEQVSVTYHLREGLN